MTLITDNELRLQSHTSLPSPTPMLVQRATQILKRPSLSEDLILKKLHHIREDIFGLSKVIGSVILGGPYPGDSKLKAILASMNLVFSDKDILETWARQSAYRKI
eukprot:TRINITY_DN2831_c0_g1_i2.p1 TRINITY_DN2831_c0_g1~~TRINITY_DN2831_c0_g1_i2.p1  ORF type:complete len:105 (+),score=19.16 TRINITY_DN2831_c0_g1_i2:777-1091(+)